MRYTDSWSPSFASRWSESKGPKRAEWQKQGSAQLRASTGELAMPSRDKTIKDHVLPEHRYRLNNPSAAPFLGSWQQPGWGSQPVWLMTACQEARSFKPCICHVVLVCREAATIPCTSAGAPCLTTGSTRRSGKTATGTAELTGSCDAQVAVPNSFNAF